MKFKYLCIFWISCLCTNAIELNNYIHRNDNFNDLVFDQYVIEEKVAVKSVTKCAIICLRCVDCMSFSLNSKEGKCRLYKTTFYQAKDGAVAQGWLFYMFGEKKCPLNSGFVYNRRNKLCFKVSDELYLYNDGKNYCLSLGSTPMTLKTREKVEAFNDTLSTSYFSSLLIGLRNFDGGWRWEDGTILGEEAYWYPDRPRPNNYCAHAMKNAGFRYEDHSCYAYPRKIICEYPLE